MNNNLVSKSTTLIGASKDKVWKALVTPSAIKEYMFGTDVEADWHKGSPITWKGEFKGKKYEDKGVILDINPEKTLQYSHFSPLAGKPDKPFSSVTICAKALVASSTLSENRDESFDSSSLMAL